MTSSSFKKAFYGGVYVILTVPAFASAQITMDSGCGGSPCLNNPLGSTSSLPALLTAILNNVVIPLGAILCALVIIYSGFLFVTARGEPGKIEDAKKTFFYAVIGTVVLLGATVISGIISTTVGQLGGTTS